MTTTSRRDQLIEIADEFQNDFLTIQGYADHHGLTYPEALTLIHLAQLVRSHPHPEE